MAAETLARDLDAAYALRDWPAVRRLCRDGLLDNPGRPEAWLMLAMAAADDGRADRARLGFARAAAVFPAWADAWASLGRIEAATAPGPARRAFRRSLALTPGNIALFGQVALRQLDLGDAAGAARWLRRAHAFAPDAWDICVNLGLALSRLEDPSAETWFAAAIALGPQEAAAHLNLGRHWLADRDLGRARTAAQRAVALVPAEVDAARLDAAALRAMGRPDEAARRLTRVRTPGPDGAAIDLQLALVHLDRRRLDDAYGALTSVYRHTPQRLPELREVLAGAATGELWLHADGLRKRLDGR